MQALSDKIVFITGASSGIGKSCAEQFAAQGANLILTARRIDRITQLADSLKTQFGINVLPIQLDVQRAEQVNTIVSHLPDQFKKIDFLINN